MLRSFHFSRFHRLIMFGEEYRQLSSSLYRFLHSSLTSPLVGPNILLSTLFFYTPNIRFLPECERQSSTPTRNNRQNYNSVYLNLYIFWYQTRRQKILHRMIETIPWLHSALNFFPNGTLIRWGCCEVFELFKPINGTINLYNVISSCTLISKYDHVLSFIRIYFNSSFLTRDYWGDCVFVYSKNASAQYIILISLNQKLMCTIKSEAILFYLNPPNGIL